MNTKTDYKAWPAVSENTYAVKEKLKAMGCRWDNDDRCWRAPEDKIGAASALVAASNSEKMTLSKTPARPFRSRRSRSDYHEAGFCDSCGRPSGRDRTCSGCA